MIENGEDRVAEDQRDKGIVTLNPVLDIDRGEEFEMFGDEAGDGAFRTSALSYDAYDQYTAEEVNENRNPDQSQLIRPFAVYAADPERDCQKDDQALQDHCAFDHRYEVSHHEEPETQEETLSDVESECRLVSSFSVAKHVGNVGGVAK